MSVFTYKKVTEDFSCRMGTPRIPPGYVLDPTTTSTIPTSTAIDNNNYELLNDNQSSSGSQVLLWKQTNELFYTNAHQQLVLSPTKTPPKLASKKKSKSKSSLRSINDSSKKLRMGSSNKQQFKSSSSNLAAGKKKSPMIVNNHGVINATSNQAVKEKNILSNLFFNRKQPPNEPVNLIGGSLDRKRLAAVNSNSIAHAQDMVILKTIEAETKRNAESLSIHGSSGKSGKQSKYGTLNGRLSAKLIGENATGSVKFKKSSSHAFSQFLLLKSSKAANQQTEAEGKEEEDFFDANLMLGSAEAHNSASGSGSSRQSFPFNAPNSNSAATGGTNNGGKSTAKRLFMNLINNVINSNSNSEAIASGELATGRKAVEKQQSQRRLSDFHRPSSGNAIRIKVS